MTYLLDTSALLAHYRDEVGTDAVHRDAHMRSIPSDASQQLDLAAASA